MHIQHILEVEASAQCNVHAPNVRYNARGFKQEHSRRSVTLLGEVGHHLPDGVADRQASATSAIVASCAADTVLPSRDLSR